MPTAMILNLFHMIIEIWSFVPFYLKFFINLKLRTFFLILIYLLQLLSSLLLFIDRLLNFTSLSPTSLFDIAFIWVKHPRGAVWLNSLPFDICFRLREVSFPQSANWRVADVLFPLGCSLVARDIFSQLVGTV
jgi:hypothetical protein